MVNTLFMQSNQSIGNHFNNSHNEIQPLLDYCRNHTATNSEKLIGALLTDALHHRFQTGLSSQHIYLKNDEVSQIQLFNILIEKFPFVKYSQLITNNAMIDCMEGSEEVTIIDIGIGQGAQIINVIASSKNLTNLKKLNIIGIEPFLDALEKATMNINGYKQKVNYEISFRGIHAFVEEYDFNQLPPLSGTVIVNASLALHHIQSQQNRDTVIAEIKKLNPDLFLLIEPNVDHFESNLQARFMNCYHHYYNIFKVIDRLDINENDKTALKLFFGREIEDVIGKAEEDRYEKHEKATTWIDRLERNGFSMMSHILKSPVKSEAGVFIDYFSEGFLGFTNETETVLAVMCAK